MNKKIVSIAFFLIAFALLFVPIMAQEQGEHDEGIHGAGGDYEIVLDILVIVAAVGGIFFGLGTFGGVIGKGMKFIFVGIGIFALDYFLQMLHHVNIDVFEMLGETGHALAHHILVLAAFVFIAYGFYKINKLVKGK